ncbi:Condensin complex subunit 3, partial [Stegodyphus mimosarum]
MVHLESSFKSVKNKDTVQELLIDILESVIHEADKTELVKKFCNLYDSFNGQGFEPSFEEVLMLILSDSKRSADVRKMLRFISDCALTLDNKYKTAHGKSNETEDEEEEEIMHPLLEYLFQILKRWSRASSYTVRCHVCQFLYMILTNIQENGVGEIAMSVYESIAKIIEERRIDASAIVRSHAVLIAKFFQDPSSVNDPVISGLCWQLQNDPNARVRQNIVEILAACEETLLPLTGRFLYDQNANVRNAALLHICDRISP